jgi:hypothetical protein
LVLKELVLLFISQRWRLGLGLRGDSYRVRRPVALKSLALGLLNPLLHVLLLLEFGSGVVVLDESLVLLSQLSLPNGSHVLSIELIHRLGRLLFLVRKALLGLVLKPWLLRLEDRVGTHFDRVEFLFLHFSVLSRSRNLQLLFVYQFKSLPVLRPERGVLHILRLKLNAVKLALDFT